MSEIMILYCDNGRYRVAFGEHKYVFYFLAMGYDLHTIFHIFDYVNNENRRKYVKKVEWAKRRLNDAKSVRLKTPAWFLKMHIIGPCNYKKVIKWIIDNYNEKDYLQKLNLDLSVLESKLED